MLGAKGAKELNQYCKTVGVHNGTSQMVHKKMVHYNVTSQKCVRKRYVTKQYSITNLF